MILLQRIGLLFILPSVLALLLPGCGGQDGLEDRSIIVVIVDTLRRDRLEAHGYVAKITPFMDRLAREGICFHRALTPSSWTKPAVASLFSGLYPGRHGVIGDLSIYQNLAFFESDFTTLAEHLKADGYCTAAFVTNANIIPFYHFDQGFDVFQQPAGDASELLEKAREWIEARRGKEKFFLYLHLIDPHAPYFPPEEYRERFVKDGPGSRAPFAELGRSEEVELWMDQFKHWKPKDPRDTFQFDFRVKELEERIDKVAPRLNLEKVKSRIYLDFQGRDDPDLLRRIEHLTSLYDGEVSYSDEMLQKFAGWLEEQGILDESIFILTSDHGEGFLEHDTWGHRRFVHNEEIDIPLVFRIPGPEGSALKGDFNERVSLLDLYPTLLDMSGLSVPEGIDGVSLWPLIQGKKDGRLRSRPIFTESFLDTGDHVSVVLDSKKIIRSAPPKSPVTWKYYDLEADPGEHNPMDPDEAGEEAGALKRAVESFIKKRTIDFKKKGEMGMPSKEEIKQLKELGYI